MSGDNSRTRRRHPLRRNGVGVRPARRPAAPVSERVLVTGAGVFGLSAAIELRRRGYTVRVLDAGAVPHPLAASTDISKVVRLAYGPDGDYMTLAAEAREGWLQWNAERETEGLEALYHETGLLVLSRDAMQPGGFELESYRRLQERGFAPERVDQTALAERFPAWAASGFEDGFYHAKGGWVESGRVVEWLAERARRAGIEVVESRRAAAVAEEGGRVRGVVDTEGRVHTADHVLLAAGAWTGKLLDGLEPRITATGHPVFHLRPRDAALFRAERFPVFTADITRTGYYGFPLHLREGVVKIGNHGPGMPIDPDLPRAVPDEALLQLRAFLAARLPALAGAEIMRTRLCLYADTADGDFWIARHPERAGLTVASGDSGHGFKFAPVLGRIIADAVEGAANPWLERFRWRADGGGAAARDAARCYEPEA